MLQSVLSHEIYRCSPLSLDEINQDWPHQVESTSCKVVFESIFMASYLEFQLAVSYAAMGFVLEISL